MDTVVTAMLGELGIPYEIRHHAEPALTAEAAAEQRNVRLSQIVKCMVARADSSYIVMLIPGDRKLKSSKARKHVRAQSLNLVPPEVLSQEFGLTVGAIAPLQLMGRARMLMDPSVLDEEIVDISSGDPMAGVELRSSELRDMLGAEMVSMISANS